MNENVFLSLLAYDVNSGFDQSERCLTSAVFFALILNLLVPSIILHYLATVWRSWAPVYIYDDKSQRKLHC